MSFEYLIGKRAELIEYNGDVSPKEELGRFRGLILDVRYHPDPSTNKPSDSLICVTLLLEGVDAGEIYAWDITRTKNLVLLENDYNVVKSKLLSVVKEREITRAELLDIEAEK